MAAFDPPKGDDHEEREIAAGEGGGKAGSGDSEGWDMDGTPGVAEDEEPVADDVDQVGGDERPGDGADVVEGLEVAAEGEVEEERWCSVVEGGEEGNGAGDDVVVDG